MLTGSSWPDETPSSEELAARISSGDGSAESQFVRIFQPGIRALVRRHSRPRDPGVDDIVQDVLQAVLRALRNNEVRSNIAGYIRSVVIFSTRAERQRQRRWAVDPDFDLSAVSDGEDPMRVALHRERAARVRLVIGELGSGRDREVIERFYLREESKSEVCRALGIDESHFRRVVFRARERLRAVLVAADVESAK